TYSSKSACSSGTPAYGNCCGLWSNNIWKYVSRRSARERSRSPSDCRSRKSVR
ncbi:unnamed protein product, partial [Nesidiocoris tenuis]